MYSISTKPLILCILLIASYGNGRAEHLLIPGDSVFVDGSVIGGSADGGSWNDAYAKLQDALMSASACDTLYVAMGTYYPDEGLAAINDDRNASFNIPDSVVVLGGFPAGGIGTRDPSTNLTILSGAIGPAMDTSDNSYQVVRMVNVSSQTRIDGFTISSGHANGPGEKINGGGLYHEASIPGDTSSPMISHCIFKNNYAFSRGGAMYNGTLIAGATCSPHIFACEFIDNVGTMFDAGAIFNAGVNGKTKAFIDSCYFEGNVANAAGAINNFGSSSGECSAIISRSIFNANHSNSNAGAIQSIVFNASNFDELVNCQFIGNTANGSGGAVYYHTAEGGTINSKIDSCTFSGNLATTVDGGAIANWSDDGEIKVQITNNQFSDNHANTSSGGAIMQYTPGANSKIKNLISNCLFENNSALYGGAVSTLVGDGTDSSKIIQSVFYGNQADYSGAFDMYTFGGSLSPLVLNCVFSKNITVHGAAQEIGGEAPGINTAKILNSIFWENSDTAGSAGVIVYGDANPAIDYCLVDTTNCLGLGGSILCGANMIYNQDPKFVDPINNDFHLKAGSPAIDAASNDSLNALSVGEDYEGNMRIINMKADMGIYESSLMPSFCDDTISLIDISIPGALYHAALKVIANGQVESMGLTEFKANNCISLLAGFEVTAGSILEASIENCQIPPMVAPKKFSTAQTMTTSEKASIHPFYDTQRSFRRRRAPHPTAFPE